jgi:hypothetical protein
LARFEALPIKALPIEALPVDTNESAIPVDTGTNESPKTDSFTFEALPLETDEPAVPSTNITELSVEDALTFNTLTLPPSPLLPLSSIPGTGFKQFHTLQRTNRNTTSTYTLTEFEFQALQHTGVG